MAMKVTRGKAGKDYPQFGIKKGQEHYSWGTFGVPTRRALEHPRPSQLEAGKWSDVYAHQEGLQDGAPWKDAEDLADALDAAAERLEEIGGEYQKAFDAMPGNAAAEERASQLEELSGELHELAERARNLETDREYEMQEEAEANAEKAAEAEEAAPAEVDPDPEATMAAYVAKALDEIYEEAMGLAWDPVA